MKYILSLLTILALASCGSSSNSENSSELSSDATQNPVTERTVDMETGKVYNVKKGDKLIKTTDDAVVRITKKAQEDATEVLLVSGEAKIIYN